MSLFSKPRNKQPEAGSSDAPPQTESAPPVWAMTEEQYTALVQKLDTIEAGQKIIDSNIRKLFNLFDKMESLHSDVRVSINNELLLIRRQDEQTTDIRQIKRVVNS